MKKVTTFAGSRGSDTKDYFVYENEDEAAAHNIEVKTLLEARKGDYIKTFDGFYVPLLRDPDVFNKGKGVYWYKFYFPLYYWHCLYDTNKKAWARKPLFYGHGFNVEHDKRRQHRKYLSKRDMLIARLLVKGTDFLIAVGIGYPDLRDSGELLNLKAHELLKREAFIKYLLDLDDMKSMLEAAKEAGLQEALFKSLKETLQLPGETKEELKFKAEAQDRAFNMLNVINKENVNDAPAGKITDASERILARHRATNNTNLVGPGERVPVASLPIQTEQGSESQDS